MPRRLALVALLVLPVAACGGGSGYGDFCDAVQAGGGVVETRTAEGVEQTDFFGSEEHVRQLERIQEAVPKDDEKTAEAMSVFLDWIKNEYQPKPGPPNPSSWPGKARVAYDRLTNVASDECQG